MQLLSCWVTWVRQSRYSLHSPSPGRSRSSLWPGWCNMEHLAPSSSPIHTYRGLPGNWLQINWVMNPLDAFRAKCLKHHEKDRPLRLDQLLCWIQLLAQLLHLLVVAETFLVILVQLQTLADVAVEARETGPVSLGRRVSHGNREDERYDVPTDLSDSWCSPRL